MRLFWIVILIGWGTLGLAQNSSRQNVERVQFCKNLQKTILDLMPMENKQSLENEFGQRKLIETLLVNLKSGKEYFNLKGISKEQDKDLFLAMSKLVGSTLGSKRFIILSFLDNELRYMPHVQKGSEIVLVVDKISSINSKRSKSVTRAALESDIKVSLLWYGSTALDRADGGKAMANIVKHTNGHLVELNHSGQTCYESLSVSLQK